MNQTRLVKPTAHLEESHASLVREFVARGEPLVPCVLAEVDDDFAEYVARLARYSEGADLQSGFVPSSTFWLVGEDDEIFAVSNLRHDLTERLLSYGGHIGFGVRPSARRRGHATEILRLTLLEARRLGIREVLVTCDKDNIGSAKAIVRNGGVFADEQYSEEHSATVQRYWIRE